jgi:hypothetical protein
MFKRMFQFSSPEPDSPPPVRNGHLRPTNTVVKLGPVLQNDEKPVPVSTPKTVPPAFDSFDQVYASAGIQSPEAAYSILKVAGMLDSKHLLDLSPEIKRNALMMALEAAAVEIGQLLQDAVARNRALDEYEEERQDHLKRFESVKEEENNNLHEELSRLTNQYMSRIQANSDQIAQEQDKFRAWQRRKQQESQRITDAATFCVPQGNQSSPGNMAALLERVTIVRR